MAGAPHWSGAPCAPSGDPVPGETAAPHRARVHSMQVSIQVEADVFPERMPNRGGGGVGGLPSGRTWKESQREDFRSGLMGTPQCLPPHLPCLLLLLLLPGSHPAAFPEHFSPRPVKQQTHSMIASPPVPPLPDPLSTQPVAVFLSAAGGIQNSAPKPSKQWTLCIPALPAIGWLSSKFAFSLKCKGLC